MVERVDKCIVDEPDVEVGTTELEFDEGLEVVFQYPVAVKRTSYVFPADEFGHLLVVVGHRFEKRVRGGEVSQITGLDGHGGDRQPHAIDGLVGPVDRVLHLVEVEIEELDVFAGADAAATLGVPFLGLAFMVVGNLPAFSLYGYPHVDGGVSVYVVLLSFQVEKEAKIGLHNFTILVKQR